MSTKQQLAKNVWESESYLNAAHEGSLDVNHPGMRLLKKLNRKGKKILDLGCGEGTRLNYLALPGQKAFGIDISRTAILVAKNRSKSINFSVGDLEKLPFKNESFDLIYSAYVFEHLENPEKVILEAKRVLKNGGDLVIICPNYGAPNRASPPFKGSRVEKIIYGTCYDLLLPFRRISELEWNKVEPIAKKDNYKSDWDVTVEPYSLTLTKYLESSGFRVIKNIQTWGYELNSAKFTQRIFRILGILGVYPFRYWSPHIVIEAIRI